MSAHPPAAAADPDDTVVPPGNFNPQARGVPTGNGWTWLADAWALFRPAAGVWIGMVLVLAVITIVAHIIPVIGWLALQILWPVFGAGLLIASQSVQQRRTAQFSELFAGFKHPRFGTLILLGVIWLVLCILIVAVVAVTTGVQVAALMAPDVTIEQVADVAARLLLAALLILALLVPLVMAVWFAPALIVFHDLGVGASMKASFAGSLKNMLPFLLYGVIVLVASFVASVPFFLGWLVLAPVLAASVYTAYRDIYFG
jgi:uncharacterized membrane protein